MTITENKMTNSFENGINGMLYNFQSQKQMNNRMFNLFFDEDYYKENQNEVEKNILNFIRYSVFGYTDEQLSVVEILPSQIEKPTEDRVILTQNEVNEIKRLYSEINPITIQRWRESKGENPTVESENVDEIKNQNNEDFQEMLNGEE